MVGGHTVDMYYMPIKYLKDYTTILKVFFKHLVFVEAAVTTVQACLVEKIHTQVSGWSPNQAGSKRVLFKISRLDSIIFKILNSFQRIKRKRSLVQQF